MTAVSSGQQGSQAVGWGSSHCPAKIFTIPEISETLRGSPTNFFGTVRQKIFDGKS